MPKYKKRKINFRSLLTIFLIAILLSGLGIAGILVKRSQDLASKAAPTASEFVTRNGTSFFLRGKPFKFVGFNLFDAANTYFPDEGKRGYSCPRDNGWWTDIYTPDDLDQAFRYIKENAGATVVRFWAFQRYTDGGQDWSGIDKVIATAKKYDMKVIPVLEDGPGYCTYPEPQGNAKWKYQNDTWYTTGYKVRQGNYKLTYPEYVRAIVTRYKDEPTIFGWMMMNEADTSLRVNGQSPLVEFARDIGTQIKSIDSKHLLTVGTQSNGASGASGKDFVDVYGLSIIDFAEVHDWPYWGGDTEPLPGSPDKRNLPDPDSSDCVRTYQAKLGCSIANSVQKLNKPIVMGEAGIAARSEADRKRRAQLMDAKIEAFFRTGGSGYLVWQLNKVVDSEGYDVQINNNDPLFAVLKKYAEPVTGTPLPTSRVTPQPTLQVTPVPSTAVTPRPTVTARPTSTPRPTVTVRPTFPSATLKPTSTPVPTQPPAVQGTLQGENLSFSSVAGRVLEDKLAQKGKTLLLARNTTAKGMIAGPIKRIGVRAKSIQCAGYGHINVKINGQYVMDQNIIAQGYATFRSNDLSYLALNKASYPIEVIFNSEYISSTCSRNVYIDAIEVEK